MIQILITSPVGEQDLTYRLVSMLGAPPIGAAEMPVGATSPLDSLVV